MRRSLLDRGRTHWWLDWVDTQPMRSAGCGLAHQFRLLTTGNRKVYAWVQYATTGYHSWTPEEVEKFEQAHPVGSKPRLALALLVYTGVRRSDVVRLGEQHVREGWLRFKQHKNRNRHPIRS